MDVNRTGIFYTDQSAQSASAKGFPKDLRSSPFANADMRFMGLLIGLFIFFGSITLALSLREIPEQTDEKQISKIQERYAQLVLNQPKPKPKPEKEPPKTSQRQKETAQQEEKDQKPEKEKSPPKKESVVEKRKRRAQSRDARKKEREEIAKQVQSAGIFKAITSSGGGGSSSGITDVLGAGGGADDLNDLQVSSGSFTSAPNQPEKLQKKGSRSSSRDLVRTDPSAASKVTQKRVASSGDIAKAQVSGQAEQVSSQSGQDVGGSGKQCINQTMRRLGMRLKRVYEHWLKRDPSLSGLIKIKFVILPSGKPANITIQSSTSGNARFDQNILRYMKRVDFSSCGIQERIEIVYPFAFESQK